MIWHALGGKMLPILRTLNLSAYLISQVRLSIRINELAIYDESGWLKPSYRHESCVKAIEQRKQVVI